jgi:hypothetical protein
MIDDTEPAGRELSPDDLAHVVGGTEPGGVSKLGSRRLILTGDGTYAGATLQLSASTTIASHEDLL